MAIHTPPTLMRALALVLTLTASAAAQVPFAGPASHRLLLTPSARSIPAGEARLGLTELAIPTAAVGVGGRVSLAMGVVAVPSDHVAGLLFVEPKVTLVETEGLAVALGATARVDVVRESQASAVPFLVATASNERVAGTLGIGARVNVKRPPNPYRFYDDVFTTPPLVEDVVVEPSAHEVWLVRSPAVFGGVEMRASPRVTVLLEGALMPQQTLRFTTGPICDPGPCPDGYEPDVDLWVPGSVHHDFSVGTAVRMTQGRASFDVGLVLARDSDGSFDFMQVAPWLSASVGL